MANQKKASIKTPLYNTPQDLSITKSLEFKAGYNYINGFSLADVKKWYRTENEFPELHIGFIDAELICDSLWKYMSVNPKRFGDHSPFKINGGNNLFRFARGEYYAEPNGKSVLKDIQYHLTEYMKNAGVYNCGSKKWSATIYTDSTDGILTYPTGAAYDALYHLFMAFRVVCDTNAKDFQMKKYHDSILVALGIADIQHARPVTKLRAKQTTPYTQFNNKPTIEYDFNDRELDAEDSNNILLDNRAYISDELYQQALLDKEYYDR